MHAGFLSNINNNRLAECFEGVFFFYNTNRFDRELSPENVSNESSVNWFLPRLLTISIINET